MTEDEQKNIPLMQWDFDNYSHEHWAEIRNGKVDETRSWVELSEDNDNELRLSLYLDKKKNFEILTYRDQWGTYVSLMLNGKGITIAQEDKTMSFIDSLIAGLNELKIITDFQTKPPTFTDLRPLDNEGDNV